MVKAYGEIGSRAGGRSPRNRALDGVFEVRSTEVYRSSTAIFGN
jgi:hypothetical protein